MGKVLRDKCAVITGGGRGIGKAIALAFTEEGAKVVVCDPGVAIDGTGASTLPADEVVREINGMGGNAIADYSDVSDFRAAEGVLKSCADNFGRVDILVNMAGIDRPRMIFNMTEEDWDKVLAVHLKGTFNTTRHACVLMRQQCSGRIINAASEAWAGTVGHVNYGAAKGGIVSLTFSVAQEMGRYGVTCNAITPLAATRFTAGEEVKAGFKRRLEAGIITKEQYERLIDLPPPQSVPPLVVYLASEAAAGINGCVFGCGGGKITIWSHPKEARGIYKDYKQEGKWTQEELAKSLPTLLEENPNP